MSLAERQLVAEVAREAWPGRQFVGISTCNVPDSLQLLNHAQQPREHLKVCHLFRIAYRPACVSIMAKIRCLSQSMPPYGM